MNRSEVALIKQRIEQEIAAAYGAIHGYAIVSRHEVISRHFDALGECLEQLTGQVGEQAAIASIIEALERQP